MALNLFSGVSNGTQAHKIVLLYLLFALCACRPSIPATAEIIDPAPAALWADAAAVMDGVCFEGALAFSGQVLTLRTADDLARFYDTLAPYCRLPIARVPFDFSAFALVGTWGAGRGCTARYDVLEQRRDGGRLTLRLRFVTEGGCDYELLRPFWIAVPAGWDVTLVFD